MSDENETARPLADVAEERKTIGADAFRERYGSYFLCFNTWDMRIRDGAATTLEPQPAGAAGGQTAPTTFWVMPLKSRDGGSRVVVGREDESDIALGDQSISTRHAAFDVDGDVVRLIDLGSKNGTFVSDALIAREGSGDPVTLDGPRASLRFGSLSVVFFRTPALLEAARMLGFDPGDD